MRKNILIIATLLCLIGLAISCDESNNGSGGNPPEPPKPLAGTKWKVAKVIHTETGVERPIYEGDEVCTEESRIPVMEFETDTTGIIHLHGFGSPSFYDFNLSDEEWFKKLNAIGIPSNIGKIIYSFSRKERWLPDYNRYYGHIGYKLENEQLKFYFHDDGFFYFLPGNVIETMYWCDVIDDVIIFVTDSNWYNCVVFEEIK